MTDVRSASSLYTLNQTANAGNLIQNNLYKTDRENYWYIATDSFNYLPLPSQQIVSIRITIYVDPSYLGGNSNGTLSDPYTSLSDAFDYLYTLGNYFAERVEIILAAGVYSQTALKAGVIFNDTLIIRGPEPPDLDTEPTAVFDGLGTDLYALYFRRMGNVTLFDLSIKHYSPVGSSGIITTDHASLFAQNIWVDDCYYGYNLRNFVVNKIVGGRVLNSIYAGHLCIDFVVSTVGQAASVLWDGVSPITSANGTYFSGGEREIFWSENCQGHVDFCRIDDTGTVKVGQFGVEMNYASRANCMGSLITGYETGVKLRSASAIIGNPTVTSNTDDWDISASFNADLGLYQTKNLGTVACLGTDTTGGSLLAVDAYTQIIPTYAVLPAQSFVRNGTKLVTTVRGAVTMASPANLMVLRVYADGALFTTAVFPSSISYATRYVATFTILAVDGTNQKGFFEIVVSNGDGSVFQKAYGSSDSALDLTSDDKNLSIYGRKVTGDALTVETVDTILFGSFAPV